MAKNAKEENLKFPKIDKTKLAKDPLNELHVFKEEDDLDCPLVAWFTLSSRSYKFQHRDEATIGLLNVYYV